MNIMVVIGGYEPICINKIFLSLGKITATLHFQDIRETSNTVNDIREELMFYDSIMFIGEVSCKVYKPFFTVNSSLLNNEIYFHFYLEDLEPV